jgi:peptide deformylase
VGLPWRLFVANPTGEPADDGVFINPELFEPSRVGESAEEGCLSLPGIKGQVRRPVSIGIRALDLDGVPFERTAEGLEARIWQHEFDHLNGVLIIDKMTQIDRRAAQKTLRQWEKEFEAAQDKSPTFRLGSASRPSKAKG